MARPRNAPNPGYDERLAYIDDVRKAVADFKEEAEKMLSHLKRLIEEYSDFEERVYQLHLKIESAETELGIKKEEIYAPPHPEVPDLEL